MENLLPEAANILATTTHLDITHTYGKDGIEGWLTLTCAKQNYKWVVESKNRLTRPTLAKLRLTNMIFKNEKVLIIAPYINENLAELCRKDDINFIDLAGNAYLNRLPLYIDIRGRKPPPEHQLHLNRQLIGKAFQPKGMKLVLMLLLKPELVNQPMRAIAVEAEIALGTVKQVLDDLKQHTFIIDKGEKGKIINEQDLLLTRWLEAYPYNLEAKLEQTLYVANNLTDIKNANLEDYDALWGGEVAADAYTHYLKPKTLLIYADKNAEKKLLKTFKFRRLRVGEDTENLIKIVEPPVAIQKLKGLLPGIAAPLLVYAELLKSNDSRNIETAKRIYNDYLT